MKRTFLSEGKVVNLKTIDKMTTTVKDRRRRHVIVSALYNTFSARGKKTNLILYLFWKIFLLSNKIVRVEFIVTSVWHNLIKCNPSLSSWEDFDTSPCCLGAEGMTRCWTFLSSSPLWRKIWGNLFHLRTWWHYDWKWETQINYFIISACKLIPYFVKFILKNKLLICFTIQW